MCLKYQANDSSISSLLIEAPENDPDETAIATDLA